MLVLGARTRKKENATGILLLNTDDGDSVAADFSIPATVNAAANLSEQVIQFCRSNGTDESSAMRIGIAVEEMAVNIARYGHKKIAGVIDIMVRITKDELLLRIRDDGVYFDPTEYHDSEEEFAVGGIEVVRRLAKDIKYTPQLGFNVTIISVPRIDLS
jgi:anti-sigma regulatory factor (Ser/Thr protein kinase)